MAKSLIMAAGGILEHDGKILLVKRLRYNDWSLPKGKLDPGETPLKAAIREVREETGINEVSYEDTEHYAVTRDFLNNYRRRLEQLLDDETAA